MFLILIPIKAKLSQAACFKCPAETERGLIHSISLPAESVILSKRISGNSCTFLEICVAFQLKTVGHQSSWPGLFCFLPSLLPSPVLIDSKMLQNQGTQAPDHEPQMQPVMKHILPYPLEQGHLFFTVKGMLGFPTIAIIWLGIKENSSLNGHSGISQSSWIPI